MHRHSGCGAFLARLGATRGGSPGIFGYTGGQAASGSWVLDPDLTYR